MSDLESIQRHVKRELVVAIMRKLKAKDSTSQHHAEGQISALTKLRDHLAGIISERRKEALYE